MNNQKFLDHGTTLARTSSSRIIKDGFFYGVIGVATLFTIGVLVMILAFIFSKGIGHIDLNFFMSDYEQDTQYLNVPIAEDGADNKLGITIGEIETEDGIFMGVTSISSKANVDTSTNRADDAYALKKGDVIKKIGNTKVEDFTAEEINDVINQQTDNVIGVKMFRPGGGVYPMIITTLMMIGLSLLIAGPIGIFAAIYLVEYAKEGRLVKVIRFATESLSGIPSIIYGLFGMIVFVGLFKFNYSLLSGALTVSIILLPIIVRQTEESLKAVPMTYREGSLGLGATKLYTIRKSVLPSAIPGIVVAIILSIGRIIGESAALLLTAGTVSRIPSLFSSGATLTVKAYAVAKEEGNIEMACAIGTVIIIMVLILNGISKFISRKYTIKH
jgi:phosphate transport system permease protein